jgi:hypothetical protein
MPPEYRKAKAVQFRVMVPASTRFLSLVDSPIKQIASISTASISIVGRHA